MVKADKSATRNKAAGAAPASGNLVNEIAAFGVSALGLNDPVTRLRAVASLGASLLRVNRGLIVKGHRKAPKVPLVLFEAEYCPFCRHVREALTELDLDAMVFPCPKGGTRFRPQVAERGGKMQFQLHECDSEKYAGGGP